MTPTRRAPAVVRSLSPPALAPIVAGLRKTNASAGRAYPGERGDRQPVHSLYGGAHLFKADSAVTIGAMARSILDEYAPDAGTFAGALALPPDQAGLAATIRARVVDKLTREPVEDYRIDFEDGYGVRQDAEEDRHAQSVAEEVAAGHAAGILPPFIGIRIKPMSKELHARSLRTLDLFVTTLARASAGRLPRISW